RMSSTMMPIRAILVSIRQPSFPKRPRLRRQKKRRVPKGAAPRLQHKNTTAFSAGPNPRALERFA
ncbi:MAG: hypothetical protein ACLVL7_15415, partial [Anaerotruncus massiliensis (ex Togo et al. 2019)]